MSLGVFAQKFAAVVGTARFAERVAVAPDKDPWQTGQLLGALALATLVFALSVGAIMLTDPNGRAAPVWLANAVIVGMLMRTVRSRWRGLIVVAFLAYIGANLVNGDPLVRAILLAAINMIECIVVITLMGRRFYQMSLFDDGRAIMRFGLYGGVVGPLVSATLAAATLSLIEATPFFDFFVGWYVADALGMLTLGALLLAVPTRREATACKQWRGAVACVVLAGIASLIIFSQKEAALLLIAAPVLMIAALSAPLIGATSALMLSTAIAIGATFLGEGPIAHAQLDPAIVPTVVQGFIASMLFVVLPVRALAVERDRLVGVIARSERLLARLDETSTAGVVHFDRLGRPTFANDRWATLTGMDYARLDEHRWLDAIAPVDRSAASSLWARAQATLDPCTGEYRLHLRGQPVRHGQLSLDPEVEDGRVLGFVARLTDVTDRHAATAAAQECEARYRLVTENANELILRLRLDGCPLYVSGAALRMTGHTPPEIVGRPLVDLIHEGDAPLFNRTLARLADGISEGPIEFRLRHRDRHYSWFEATHQLLFDDDGHPFELIASLRDVERRRQAEATAAMATARLVEAQHLLDGLLALPMVAASAPALPDASSLQADRAAPGVAYPVIEALDRCTQATLDAIDEMARSAAARRVRLSQPARP